jgi:flagellar basal body P-ring protein FlgI
VTGLQQTGDIKGSIEAATLYAEQLSRIGVPAALEAINKGQGIALVTVTAEIDENWVQGLEFDCQIAVAGGGAESLLGGQLWVTPMKLNLTQLFQKDTPMSQALGSLSGIIATASGRIDVPNIEGQPTRGLIRRGLKVLGDSPFVAEARNTGLIVFDITNPALRTLTVAKRFVDVINHEMLVEGYSNVAEIRSGSQIFVSVPEGYDVLEFTAEVLNFALDVDDIETPATIRWTPSTGVLVVSGNTRVNRNASVSVQGFAITMFDPSPEPTVQNPNVRIDQWANTEEPERPVRGTLRELKIQLDTLRVPTAMQAAVLEQLVNAGMVTASFINTEEGR